jgi:hypothetical protein
MSFTQVSQIHITGKKGEELVKFGWKALNAGLKQPQVPVLLQPSS